MTFADKKKKGKRKNNRLQETFYGLFYFYFYHLTNFGKEKKCMVYNFVPLTVKQNDRISYI